MQDKYITQRLLLDKLAPEDAEFILELVNTPGWIKFIGDRNIGGVEDAAAYITKIMDNPNVDYWVVRPKTDNKALGIITFIRRDYLEHPDIGFAFLPAHMGQGYAVEAARVVLDDGVLAHTHILATTIKENTSSIGLLQKLGLRFRNEITEDGELLHVYAVKADKVLIDRLTQAFFGLFTNANGRQPELDSIADICLPEAVIIKQTGLDGVVYDLKSFTAPRIKILTDGTLTEFEEKETTEETTIKGNIAQRWSVYEKRGVLEGVPFRGSGNKLFQFVNTAGGWRVSSLVWEDGV